MNRILLAIGCVLTTSLLVGAGHPGTHCDSPKCANCESRTKIGHPDIYGRRSCRQRRTYSGSEPSPRVFYEARNLYYYHRPYQFRQSEMTAKDYTQSQLLRENLKLMTRDRSAANQLGNLDSLEFADLQPSPRQTLSVTGSAAHQQKYEQAVR